MTVSSTTRTAGPFAGNGVTVAFPFSFRVFEVADLVVVLADSSDVETTLTINTHYTVALNADQDGSPGGTVTMLTAPATGEALSLTSDVEPLQGVELAQGGAFDPLVITEALDRLTVNVQELKSELARTLRTALTSGVDGAAVTPAAGELVMWNGTATALISLSVTSLGVTAGFPSQTGNSGKYLTTNGATPSWAAFGYTYTRGATTANSTLLLQNTSDTAQGGIAANTAGKFGFIRPNGQYRFSIDAAGEARVYPDGDTTGIVVLTTASGAGVSEDTVLAYAAALGAG